MNTKGVYLRLNTASCALTLDPRYIDQCEEILNAQTMHSERKDLNVYQAAIDTSNGMGSEWCKEEVFENFVAYVGKRHVYETTKELLPITFNYEKWLFGSHVVHTF